MLNCATFVLVSRGNDFRRLFNRGLWITTREWFAIATVLLGCLEAQTVLL